MRVAPEDQFTIRDNRLFKQIIEDYNQQRETLERLQKERQELERQQAEKADNEQKQIEQQKIEQIKAEEKQLEASRERTKEFLNEARMALDYNRCSTAMRFAMNDKAYNIRCVSIQQSATDYALAMMALTNNFDKETMDALEATRTVSLSNTVFRNPIEYEKQTFAPLRDDNLAKIIDECRREYIIVGNVKVQNVVCAVNNAKIDREEFGIRDNDIINGTVNYLHSLEKEDKEHLIHNHIHALGTPRELIVEKTIDFYDRGYRAKDAEKLQKATYDDAIQVQAHCIFLDNFEKYGINEESIAKAVEEIYEKNIPVEIVESFDGYVLNTNRAIAEKDKEFDSKVHRGNEVIHNEVPMHTTIDTAEVGGTVKLEQADDIGTIEKQQGIPTWEEKTEREENQKNDAEKKSNSSKVSLGR